MSADSGKVSRRRRRTPQRRTPAIVEQPVHQPWLFGWGASLSQRERESLKERFALFAGIAIALVVGAIIGWGAFYDNVWQPHQQSLADARPVAVIGNYTVTTGFLKSVQQLNYNSTTNDITTLQQQIASYEANPKQNASLISQAQSQLSQDQQSLSGLASQTLTEIIDDQIAIQRGKVVGVYPTASNQAKANLQLEKRVGGKKHFDLYIQTSGVSRAGIEMLLLGGYMQAQIQKKVLATVPQVQLEVRARHILVATSKHALALQILHQVEAAHGSNFAALAKKYSIDPSKSKGGDLGYFTKSEMVAPFANLAFKLKVGQFGIVKSQFGWHVIQVTGREQKRLSAQAYQQAQGSAYQTWLDQQKAIIREQDIVPPSSLPNIPTPTAVPGQSTNPVQVTPAPVATVPPTRAPTKKK